MPIINKEHTALIQSYVVWFKDKTIQDFRGIIGGEVGTSMPPEVIDLENQLGQLVDAFTVNAPLTVDLSNSLIPIFKRMMIEVRRRNVPEIESRQEKTHHPYLLQMLDEKLRPITELMEQEWVSEVEPARIPLLTQYIPLKRFEEIKAQSTELPARDYDQKFRILQAPGLIIDDLHYYREKCSLRGAPVVVAFIDVDNFKKNFNEKYGEIEIDRRVLPVLMSKLEAHVFNHGFAYRHGGDEFVLVLPNMAVEVAPVFLDTIRRSIENLQFHGIEQRATISIGFVLIDSDCFLTDREIVEKANAAKKFAKGETGDGKNRIATFRGTQFSPTQLIIVDASYPSVRSS